MSELPYYSVTWEVEALWPHGEWHRCEIVCYSLADAHDAYKRNGSSRKRIMRRTVITEILPRDQVGYERNG